MRKGSFVVIPFKGPEDTKNRLSFEKSPNGILFPDERRTLSDCLVRDLYRVWRKTIGDDGEVIVGVANDRDNTVIPQYAKSEINVVKMPYPDINPSLAHLAQEAQAKGYEQFIVSGSDLPLITQADINYLFERMNSLNSTNGKVVFSQGKRGGTTVYLISPPTSYKIELYSPGKTNLEHQIERLKNQKMPFKAIDNRVHLYLDLDYPDDLLEIYLLMLTNPEVYQDRKTYQYLIPLVQGMREEETERGERVRKLFERFEY